MGTVWKVLTRKKAVEHASEETRLQRVLTTFDLTALGVGSTLGVGVYVIAGEVAKKTAGPSVVLSFLIATVASVFAGLCYAEFGARVPKAGSAYVYSYVCVGEFVAFVIGWNLILEYVIGSASVARGLSLYLDHLLNDTMKIAFIDVAPIHVSFMSSYFDFFAFGITLLLSVAISFGLKESTIVNNIFTLINIGVVIFVVIAGSIKADTKNWHVPANSSDKEIGKGGFFPFGIEGMIKGAATCFYGFVGFDCIATTGEEVKNPKKAIPISIIFSLFIIFLAYFGTSTVVTLLIPYYEQDINAPIPHAFDVVGWNFAKWVVSVGGIFGLCASLFGAMIPLPRIIYAMASDNIIFKFLGKVSARFQTPVVGTLIAGILTGLMAALFELSHLVNMMSIGTLLAYTLVATSVLLLRYTRNELSQYVPVKTSDSDDDDDDGRDKTQYTDVNTSINDEGEHHVNVDDRDIIEFSSSSLAKQLFNSQNYQHPTKISKKLVGVEIVLFCIMSVFIGLCALYLKRPIGEGELWSIILTAAVILATILLIMSIATQPTSNAELSFKVPLVPLIPALSIMINIYLMLMLDPVTWIRFGVWMAVGIPIYYFTVRNYSIAKNSELHKQLTNGRSSYDNLGFEREESTRITHVGSINGGVKMFENATLNGYSKKGKENENEEVSTELVIAELDDILEREDKNINISSSNLPREISVASSFCPSVVDVVIHDPSDVLPDLNPIDSVFDPKNDIERFKAIETKSDLFIVEQTAQELAQKNSESFGEGDTKISSDLIIIAEVPENNVLRLKVAEVENGRDILKDSNRTIESSEDNSGRHSPHVAFKEENSLFLQEKISPKPENIDHTANDRTEPQVETPELNRFVLLEDFTKEQNSLSALQKTLSPQSATTNSKGSLSDSTVETSEPIQEGLKDISEQAAESYGTRKDMRPMFRIPSPPPQPDYELIDSKIPSTNKFNGVDSVVLKPIKSEINISNPSKFNYDDIKTVTLKRVKVPDKKKEEPPSPSLPSGHIKFGSEEFKNFLGKLDDNMKVQVIQREEFNKKKAHYDPNKNQISNAEIEAIKENVIVDNIDRDDAKGKLFNHLIERFELGNTDGDDLSGSEYFPTNKDVKMDNSVDHKPEISLFTKTATDEQSHRKNMATVLQSLTNSRRNSNETQNTKKEKG